MTEGTSTPDPDAGSPPANAFSLYAGRVLSLLLISAGGLVMFAYSAEPSSSEPAQAAAAVSAPDPFAGLLLKGKSAVVIDIATGKTLYALNPDAQLPLASLTKVALVLAVVEVLDPEQVITIPRDTAQPGSTERLGRGERWKVGDIIDFTLVASSNAGAEILADAANDALHARYPDSPARGATLWRMNQLVGELGLRNTYYLNVSGLDESASLSGGYGTATDMAKLFAYVTSAHAGLYSATARDGLLLTSAGGTRSTSAINTNDAQGKISGLILGKTGLTDLAGGNLGVVFDIGPAHPIVAVVLGSTEAGRFTDMEQLVTSARAVIATP